MEKSSGVEEIGFSEYDWDKIHLTIDDFLHKRESQMPCVDLLTDHIDTLISNFAEISVLILEGLYAFHAKADERIFIDLTYKETKEKQKLRGKEPVNDFRMLVLEREHQVIHAFKQKATFIVHKDYSIEKHNGNQS
jgi:uridine kinase